MMLNWFWTSLHLQGVGKECKLFETVQRSIDCLFWPLVTDGWKFLKIQKTIDAYKITTNGPNDFKFWMVVLCMDIKLFVKKKI